MPTVSGFNKELLGAERFGYEGGAFTGTDRKGKPGLLEMADRGTQTQEPESRLERMP
jgi:transcriptional regulator with PAS, ATPase and Fis domain